MMILMLDVDVVDVYSVFGDVPLWMCFVERIRFQFLFFFNKL